MKAARFHRFGGNEVIVIDEVAVPVAGDGEVLVRVEAAGVNPVDWKIRSGLMSKAMSFQLPYTLGCDVSGVVESIGSGVRDFDLGDAVFGYPNLLRSGAFSQWIVMNELELALAPQSISLEHAAAIPVAAITAYDGLFTYGQLDAGMKVLVLGGSGGVGSAAVQLARAKGAEVFATASARNQQWLSDMGATPIDYAVAETFAKAKDVDLIFDTVGVQSAIEALPCLKRGGWLVSSVYALPPDEVLAPYGAKSAMYGIQPSGERLREIAKLVDDGSLRMAIDRVFQLEETAAALEASQAGRTRGKLLIKPWPAENH